MAAGANSDGESRLRAPYAAAFFLPHLSAPRQSLAADSAAKDRDWIIHQRACVRDCRVDSTKAGCWRTAPCDESDSRVRLSDGWRSDGVSNASGIRLHAGPEKIEIACHVHLPGGCCARQCLYGTGQLLPGKPWVKRNYGVLLLLHTQSHA